MTPKGEAILRASALHSPILGEQIERVLSYRVQVAEEFERLIEVKGSFSWIAMQADDLRKGAPRLWP